ncbi:MAG: polyprenyl synthetase family protein [Cellvibrionaceae bacterium]|nr:polyprenyl synthetase family protein [Cellvibrionaceae bacterium]
MNSFQTVIQNDFDAVNSLIIKQLQSDVGLVENIGHYIVNSGGKRLRPILVLLAAKALHYSDTDHLPLAAIIEFIHTATLLHDDVVDASALRRGRPTANANWGNAPSVLVGDFLYSRAFQMMVNIGNMGVMDILSNTTNVIAEGEVQQLANAKRPDVTEAEYFTVIHKKTAALFEAACETACIIANSPKPTREHLKRFGYHLGLAFQLVDDALDYRGDTQKLGKNVGDDLAEGKLTLPLIQALSKAQSDEKQIIEAAITQSDTGNLEQILQIVQRYQGLEFTQDIAKQHATSAIECLQILDDSTYKSALIELAEFSVARTY